MSWAIVVGQVWLLWVSCSEGRVPISVGLDGRCVRKRVWILSLRLQWGRVTIGAGFNKDGKGMPRPDLAPGYSTFVIFIACQMTINAVDTRFIVHSVGGIRDPVLMTACAQRIGVVGCACFLGMHLMAVCTRHVCRAMTA